MKLRIATILLKRKNRTQLLRLFFTRVPLFSMIGSIFYRAVFFSRYYDYINRKALLAFNADKPKLNSYKQNVLSTIKREGCFVVNIEDFLSNEIILNQLTEDAESMFKSRLDEYTDTNDIRPPKIRGIGRNVKDEYLPRSFVEFFLSDTILDVVNSYFGKFSRLNYADAWLSIPASEKDYFYSTEHWHRDHEDIHVIKIFLYLVDVDDSMGCFYYLRGTHTGGKLGHINPANPPRGVQATDFDIETILSADAAASMACVGERGSIIISDTSGFHKGGRTSSQPRKVLVAFFTTDAGVDQHSYRLPETIDINSLSPAAKYALRLEGI